MEGVETLGWIFAIAGAALFLIALGMTARANAGASIPYSRSPAVSPTGSIALRSIGAGLLVFGAAALAPSLGYWAAVIVLAVPITAFVVIVRHNRQVATRRAD